MSPLATWLISCPSTASISSLFMFCNRPMLIATSASFLFQPVAKALGEALGKMPTSGISIPASLDRRATVSSSQRSVELMGCSIIFTPMLRLAIHLEANREMKEPVNPITADMINRAFRFRPPPCRASMSSTPRMRMVMLSTARMATLVPSNNSILNIFLAVPESRFYHSGIKYRFKVGIVA